ncbi:MAG: chloride channel protein [Candidatus Binataceae bacterium]
MHRLLSLVSEDLAATYSRAIQKWLLVAPIIGIITGVIVTIITLIVLSGIWAVLLPYYLHHHWAIIPGLVVGFFITGLIMQYLTHDPDEHSTEEIIRSYHDHQGDIDMRPFWFKLIAAITTVGSGGSAALEGPGIYAGGGIGSWLWLKLRRFRRFKLEPRDRRLMMISGAGAGMAAVFRAPLTGVIFAMEMPYKDDLAHEALLPSLIASVISYATLVTFVGSQPLFNFIGKSTFHAIDLPWAALVGAICGLIAMGFAISFRHARQFSVNLAIPHTAKMVIGGLLTGMCGLIFIYTFPGKLIPLGTNYEAVGQILTQHHTTAELVIFVVLKLAATLFTLGVGGVSAMFVPLFLVGGCIGIAFSQGIVHASNFDLYAAVGMASFIAAGYKTPLTAVIFVAETTGSHFYIIPSLIGAAVSYAISGEASVSGDQHLRETAQIAELTSVQVSQVMQRHVVSVQRDVTLRDFADSVASQHQYAVYPVYDGNIPIGTVGVWSLGTVSPDRWSTTKVLEITNHELTTVPEDTDVMEALRLLTRENGQPIIFVAGDDGSLAGIITKTDILRAVPNRAGPESNSNHDETGSRLGTRKAE